jgi:hypothetical protein
MTGMWPIHDTLRDFLVHPEAAMRHLMLELEPILRERSEEDEDEEEGDDEDDDGEGDDDDGEAEAVEEEGGDGDGEEVRQVKKQKVSDVYSSL